MTYVVVFVWYIVLFLMVSDDKLAFLLIKYKVYSMKISVSVHEGSAHLRIHTSKSKSRLKNILNQDKAIHKTHQHPHSSVCQTDLLTQNHQPNPKYSLAKSKKSCDHKKKHYFEGNGEYELQRVGHRTLDQLQKENEKLRKENKVLNEYFVYFESKLGKQRDGPSERVVSFRNQSLGRGRQLFGELSKETTLTSCKSASKFSKYPY